MADQWFKFWGTEYLGDSKILSLGACDRSCWVTLLAQASAGDGNGEVKYLTEEKLMIQAGVDFQREEWNETKGVLKRLEELGMITLDNGIITVLNWNKRQERKQTPYERVKKHREKKRSDNAMLTSDNKNDNYRREEKRREENIKIKTSVSFGEKIKNKAPEYSALVKELAETDYLSARQIHQIALEEFLPHWEEKGEGQKKSRWEKERSFDYLLRFRTWMKNHHSWKKDSRCRSKKWHKKDETCYCEKQEPVLKMPLLPSHTEAIRMLAESKKVGV